MCLVAETDRSRGGVVGSAASIVAKASLPHKTEPRWLTLARRHGFKRRVVGKGGDVVADRSAHAAASGADAARTSKVVVGGGGFCDASFAHIAASGADEARRSTADAGAGEVPAAGAGHCVATPAAAASNRSGAVPVS